MAARRYPKARSAEARGAAEGYRSGLEDKIAAELAAQGVDVEYEQYVLRYVVPERAAKYTPDWVFLHNGVVVESKGRFVTSDRTKHRHIKEQFPDLDLRFVFSRPTDKIGKKSKTTYADWCDRLGIKWAAKSIPTAWLKEPPQAKRIAAIKQLIRKTSKE